MTIDFSECALEEVMTETNNLTPLENFELSFPLYIRRLSQWFHRWNSDNLKNIRVQTEAPSCEIHIVNKNIFIS
jgi:hypothetical protein